MAQTKSFFENIESVILINLKNAKSSVKIAVAWCTNPKIFDLLHKLHSNNIVIQVIVADDKINFTVAKNQFQSLIDANIEVKVSRYPRLMHHKFCVIDDRLLLTGSYNWTRKAELTNHENIIISTDITLVNEFRKAFNDLCEITTRVFSIDLIQYQDYGYSTFENQAYDIQEKDQTYKTSSIEISLNSEAVDESTKGYSLEIQQLINEANCLYMIGKYDASIELCIEILKTYGEKAIVYEILSTCKWRQKKYGEQVRFSQKAIELDNMLYSAYNILGLGCSCIKGKEQDAINYFTICIDQDNDPERYVYLHNRGLCYLDMCNDKDIPNKKRLKFKSNAIGDFSRVVAITNSLEDQNSSYKLFFMRGIAQLELDLRYPAKADLERAKSLYESAPKFEKDVAEYKEIKAQLRDVKKNFS